MLRRSGGFIDYGPLGAMMKRRIENIWRHFYVVQEGYYEIECPTIAQEAVFIAPGHVKGFSDKMCQCPHCKEYLRADHVADGGGVCGAATMNNETLAAAIATCKCPACGEVLGNVDVYNFNLMFQTWIGEKPGEAGYLRPETAQGMFVDFPRLLRFYRDERPFGAVQRSGNPPGTRSPPVRALMQVSGSSRRRRPRSSSTQTRRTITRPLRDIYELPDATSHLRPPAEVRTCGRNVDEGRGGQGHHRKRVRCFYAALTHELLVTVGIRPAARFRQHLPDERAHYATDCWDAEVYSERFGWVETVGIADRTNYDLNAHAKQSGTSMTVFIQYDTPKKVERRRIIPNMGVLGKQYRQKAKAIFAALETATPTPEGADVTVDGETIHIPADLFEVRDEVIDVRGEEVVPHVIEPSYGIDRMCYAVLEQAYDEDTADGEKRVVLRLSPQVAPVQVAVFPLMTRDGLDTLSEEITTTLQKRGILAEYDDSGAIGRRYRRQDEIGTPFAITVDYESKETHTVTDPGSGQHEAGTGSPSTNSPQSSRLLSTGA